MALTGRQKAQAKYNAKPEQKKRRAARNATRRKLIKAGRVRVGDGNDIDHKNHNPFDNSPTNLEVQRAEVNRRDGGPQKINKNMRSVLLNPKKRKKK